jgi:ABC-type enterochelin transport system permease subunit
MNNDGHGLCRPNEYQKPKDRLVINFENVNTSLFWCIGLILKH